MDKELKLIIILFVSIICLLVGVLTFSNGAEIKSLKNGTSAYSTIIIDGKEYETSTIKEIKARTRYDLETEFEITFNDDTKVFFTNNSYSLKDKKPEEN
jgi:hypothetical protein